MKLLERAIIRNIGWCLILIPTFYMLKEQANSYADYWIPVLCIVVMVGVVEKRSYEKWTSKSTLSQKTSKQRSKTL